MDNFYRDKYNLDEYLTHGSESFDAQPDRSTGKRTSPPRGRQRAQARKAERKLEAKRMKKEHRAEKKALKNSQKSPQRRTRKSSSEQKKERKTRRFQPRQKPSTLALGLVLSSTVMLLIAIVIIAGVVYMNIEREKREDQPLKMSEGVKISGIDISGMSMNSARKKLEKEAMSVIPDFKLTVIANDISAQYTKSDFVYSFNFEEPLKLAREYSQKEQGISKGSKSSKGEELVMPELKLEYTLDEDSVTKIVKSLAKKIDKDPVNAKVKSFKPFAKTRFTYENGSDGYLLYQDELQEQIDEFLASEKREETISAEVEVLKPDINVRDLKTKIVGLAAATTISYNTENGNHNMKTALKACNGSVINPGEVWSFNECTGDSNLESNGYKKATVINNHKLEQGVGGGICQASTTIFQAAAFANMEIYSRQAHYWASSYAYAGEDATIDYPYTDLQLRNTTEFPMFIECKMEGTELLVNIYGFQESFYDNVKIYSKNHDIETKKSFKTTTYRVLYKNGKIVRKEVLCESTYSLSDNYSVRDPDNGTFRTMVDGTSSIESDPKPNEGTSSLNN